MALRALVVLSTAAFVAAKLSDHWNDIHTKCSDAHCPDENHPILDYNETAQECVCREHPCHNHNGVKWTCDDPEFPYLSFSYNKDAELDCVCKQHPCPEDTCDSEEHEIRWDHNGVCFCGPKKKITEL
eukprot:Hpha_TRINITY_DN30412_c0_g1::TRINITY_DN30412_c0_g1_i1::g.168075::m.168075